MLCEVQVVGVVCVLPEVGDKAEIPSGEVRSGISEGECV